MYAPRAFVETDLAQLDALFAAGQLDQELEAKGASAWVSPLFFEEGAGAQFVASF